MSEFFKDYKNLLNSIEKIKKNAEGYGYNYADLPNVLDSVMQHIYENNFILIQKTQKSDSNIKRHEYNIPERNKDGTVFNTEHAINFEMPCYELVSELKHASGESIISTLPLMYDDIDPQALGSAQTYNRRYAIYELLGLKIEDDDGVRASRKGKSNFNKQKEKLETFEDFEKAIENARSAKQLGFYYYQWKDKFTEEQRKTLEKKSGDKKLQLQDPDLNVEVR